MWHKGTGRIVYDPPRPGLKHKTKGWCVLPVDREITRYYRWWIKKEKHIDLCQPSWDAHISVVRGETLSEEAQLLWRKHHGARVDFRYEHNPRVAKKSEYWTVAVECEFLDNIRAELGLVTGWNYHITVGRSWN